MHAIQSHTVQHFIGGARPWTLGSLKGGGGHSFLTPTDRVCSSLKKDLIYKVNWDAKIWAGGGLAPKPLTTRRQ